jgi:transposase-like protein
MVERVKRKQRQHEHAGQPTKYNADHMPRLARFMCQRGAVMSEVADAFNVSTRTLFNWLNLHPELHDAVQVGVDTFNSRVERALAERAIGFWVTVKEEVRGEQGEVIQPEQRRYYPPDPTSIIFFLKNRMRDKYRDVHKVENEVRLLKTSDELRIEVYKDILDLQAQGYDPKIIDDDDASAPPAPKRGNGSGNGAG